MRLISEYRPVNYPSGIVLAGREVELVWHSHRSSSIKASAVGAVLCSAQNLLRTALEGGLFGLNRGARLCMLCCRLSVSVGFGVWSLWVNRCMYVHDARRLRTHGLRTSNNAEHR